MICPGCARPFASRLALGVHLSRAARQGASCGRLLEGFRRESVRERSIAYDRRRGRPARPRYTPAERRAVRLAAKARYRRTHPRPSRALELAPIPPLHVGHPVFDLAREVVGRNVSGLTVLLDPLHEDLLSVAALALLEGRDALEAVRRFRARETAWRRVTAPIAPGMGV
jgi:hypothetical protein